MRYYARPDVAPACLALQERNGVDVNLLLFCLWAGAHGDGRLAPRDMAALAAGVQTWHRSIVRPLRAARRALKDMLAGDMPASFAAAAGRLRAAVKRLELDAEHIEQLLLADQGRCRARRAAALRAWATRTADARANVGAYFASLALVPDSTSMAAVETLITALADGDAPSAKKPARRMRPRHIRQRKKGI
ncbi:MAG: TIGR02444 family protein [Rhodospirillales bacterium]|nr:TIGR02444 family protein [Rhodospirillales bacterium]